MAPRAALISLLTPAGGLRSLYRCPIQPGLGWTLYAVSPQWPRRRRDPRHLPALLSAVRRPMPFMTPPPTPGYAGGARSGTRALSRTAFTPFVSSADPLDRARSAAAWRGTGALFRQGGQAAPGHFAAPLARPVSPTPSMKRGTPQDWGIGPSEPAYRATRRTRAARCPGQPLHQHPDPGAHGHGQPTPPDSQMNSRGDSSAVANPLTDPRNIPGEGPDRCRR